MVSPVPPQSSTSSRTSGSTVTKTVLCPEVSKQQSSFVASPCNAGLVDPTLSSFSLLPSISHSRFSPPNSAAPFPLSLSPSIVSLYSTVMPSSIPANFRSAENVSAPSFSFRSLTLASSWSGQLIVPARWSPSFLILMVDVRCCPPISYSHFQVPTGSTTLSSAAPAMPHTPRNNAIERIAFMIASEIVPRRKQPEEGRHPSVARIVSMPRPAVTR